MTLLKKLFFVSSIIFLFKCISSEDLFPLSIIHLNDMHAKFEETNLMANTCKDPNECIGGYARVVSTVRKLKSSLPNPIYMNVADNFQGTLWYNMFRWNATQYFLNIEPADVMTIGNHEFDHSIAGLIPFLERVNIPVISCNIDTTHEPEFGKLFNKSIIIERGGRQIGIVGVTTTFPSGWGKAVVLPEVENVKKEVDSLVEKGIKIIIVLSHSGLDVDREIAKHGGAIDIIVGGHSHSFLYSGTPVGPDTPVSDYPTIEEQENGRKVLIVQASAYNKYLGNITLYFDDEGEIQNHEGAPIFLSNDIEQDPEVVEKLKPWKAEVDTLQNKMIGKINFQLDSYCYQRECGMGDLVTDSMVYAFLDAANEDEWTGAAVAFQVPGGVRAGLEPGNVIYADLITTTPFENKLISLELPGSAIREALEFSVSELDNLHVLQVSGLKVTYNLSRDSYDRVIELKVLSSLHNNPRYEDIDDKKHYRVIAPSFLAEGGDDYKMFAEHGKNPIEGPVDIDALVNYIEKISPLNLPPLLNRITFV